MNSPSEKGTTAKRYSAEEKEKIIQFIKDYKAQNGRGAQKEASIKFGVSAVTLTNWMKATKKKRGRKPGSKNAPSATKHTALKLQNPDDLRRLAEVLEQIQELEEQVEKLDQLRQEAAEISARILK